MRTCSTETEYANEHFRSRLEKANQLHDRGIDLCYVYRDYNSSLKALQQALYLRESTNGKFHHDTALSYFRIASVLCEGKGMFREGLKMARRELRISHGIEMGYDKNTQDTLITSKAMRHQKWLIDRLCWFANALDSVPDLSSDKKNEFCQQLLESIAMEQLGDSFLAHKNWEKAMTHYNSAFALECNAFVHHTLDAADLQVKIAECLVYLGDPEAAVEELKQSLRKHQQHRQKTDLDGTERGLVDGPSLSHSFIGEICSKIGFIYLSQKRFDEALGEHAKAYSIFEECLGKNHPRSKEVLADMKVVAVREMEYLRHEEHKRKRVQKNRKPVQQS
jgi:tetratricopeptide (TPR) repeat protein